MMQIIEWKAEGFSKGRCLLGRPRPDGGWPVAILQSSWQPAFSSDLLSDRERDTSERSGMDTLYSALVRIKGERLYTVMMAFEGVGEIPSLLSRTIKRRAAGRAC